MSLQLALGIDIPVIPRWNYPHMRGDIFGVYRGRFRPGMSFFSDMLFGLSFATKK
jgi:hypothetical protein